MKINSFKAYSNPVYPANGTGNVNGLSSYSGSEAANLKQKAEDSSGNIITPTEREFFIKMFPQNTEQLENHVVFNRNGKIQSTNVALGRIFDGRV